MTDDNIIRVEIDEGGKLCVASATQNFALIYRAAMEVSWDPVRNCLISPKPREWSYPMWFRQILAAAADEYGVCLRLTPKTLWTNIPDEVRLEMSAGR